jgi:hypothetical protein
MNIPRYIFHRDCKISSFKFIKTTFHKPIPEKGICIHNTVSEVVVDLF